MRFNKHSHLEGRHAFLSASKGHWINYTDDKLDFSFKTALAAALGTEKHEFAYRAIKLGIKLPETTQTMNLYVNDAIGYRMNPEQVLYYSDNAFGTADTLSFRNNMLRIHDLKTGVGPVKMMQLEIYAALFCLEYEMKPGKIEMELRMYQNDSIVSHIPEVDKIVHIMDRIVTFDKRIDALREEAYS